MRHAYVCIEKATAWHQEEEMGWGKIIKKERKEKQAAGGRKRKEGGSHLTLPACLYLLYLICPLPLLLLICLGEGNGAVVVVLHVAKAAWK